MHFITHSPSHFHTHIPTLIPTSTFTPSNTVLSEPLLTPTGRPSTPRASYYSRSPRPAFLKRLRKKFRRVTRDIQSYAERHPIQIFTLVILPLISGGYLTNFLAKLGLKLPKFVEKLLGVAAKAGRGDSIGAVNDAVRLVTNAAGSGGLSVSKYVKKEKGNW